ncbi:ABC-type transport system involved in multi-copper enzyme maturation permease subunit [Metamycoplasma subdolum]|uniref:ABC-type transport system involved in multi-copper enzyme maturation permease subunit n=1 Tax=Metamycoplasma subdolum TaxID=92407 RepID=A0A3M0A496_9BACT|nr:hypothetical protein [Metamycoplasma subdolum]RMA77568.1 ABC-type transport system involved in multi-copper enzyme maturation permease subunit [Metamycoplasma subdolum]WPB50362.1 hypothetical protein R9C05_02040 [Metamycoplasma subdolum]
MNTFFKVQLKMFFRQPSTYFTSIIMALLHIGVSVAIFISFKVAGNNDDLIYSRHSVELFRSFIAPFGVISSFMATSIAVQSLFYKYKEEGMFYIMQSKPITRNQIYWATILAGLVVIAWQSFIISLGYFAGAIIYPIFSWKSKILSWMIFYAGFCLIGIFTLALGALIHNFIQSKPYQFVTGGLPTIIIVILNFIASPSETKKQVIDNVAATKVTKIVSRDDDAKLGKYLANPASKFKYWIENRLDNEKISDLIKDNNNSLYNKIFWMNPSTYFTTLYFEVDKQDAFTTTCLYADKVKYGENEFQNSLKNNEFVFKTIDHNAEGKEIVNYFALSYNPPMMAEIATVKTSEDPLFINMGSIIKNFNTKEIEAKTENGYKTIKRDLINKIDELYLDDNFVLNKTPIVLTPATLMGVIKSIQEDEALFEIIKKLTVDYVSFKNEPTLTKKEILKLSQADILKKADDPAFITFTFKFNLVKQTAIVYLLSKLIHDKNNSTLVDFNYADFSKYMNRANLLSGLKIVRLNSGSIVEFGSKKYMHWTVGLFVPLIISAILIAAGAVVFSRKDY